MESPNLLQLVTAIQEGERVNLLEEILSRDLDERRKTDVTGTWLGYSDDGYGLVEYAGKTYKCIILSNKCKQKYSKVNLRRATGRGGELKNFVDWQ